MMWSRRIAMTSSRVNVPPVSQPGSWLCHTSVWPRTAMPLAWANATSASASTWSIAWDAVDGEPGGGGGRTVANETGIVVTTAGGDVRVVPQVGHRDRGATLARRAVPQTRDRLATRERPGQRPAIEWHR